jgi:hypothetical protein
LMSLSAELKLTWFQRTEGNESDMALTLSLPKSQLYDS